MEFLLSGRGWASCVALVTLFPDPYIPGETTGKKTSQVTEVVTLKG